MNKKKKIIFSTIAIVLVLAIIGVILYSMFRRPTIDELFDKNREYFNSLESLETEIVIDFESCRIEYNKPYKLQYDCVTNVQTHLLSNTSVAKQNAISIQNDEKFDIAKTIYKVNEEDAKQLYYNEIIFNVDSGWILDKTDEQINALMDSNDFGIIESFSNSFKIEKQLVEIDGILCYKATAKIFKPSKISNYYCVKTMLGEFVDLFMEYSFDATVYFRKDTGIIYCIVYDFTDVQHRIFEINAQKQLEYGNFYLSIYFKDFNTTHEIVVPDEIRDISKPYVGNEIEDPIDVDDKHYSVSSNSNIKIGTIAKEYSEQYKITQQVLDNTIENYEMINANEYGYLSFVDQYENYYLVCVQNCTEVPMHYLDCHIAKICVAEYNCPDFNKFGIGESININSTIQDCKAVLGRYTKEFDNGEQIEYQWRSYIDYCEIQINFNKETGKIEYFHIWSWDLKYYMNK